jgi:hypothetical protein
LTRLVGFVNQRPGGFRQMGFYRRGNEGALAEETFLVPDVIWTLGAGVKFVACVYWLIHHSSLNTLNDAEKK